MAEDSRKIGKYGLYGAIIAAIIYSGVHLYIHYDTKSRQPTGEVIQEKQKTQVKKEDTTKVSIEKVLIPPTNFNLPSSFYLEIQNTGQNNAKDFLVTIDFGEAGIKELEYRPKGIADFLNKDETLNIIKLRIANLEKREYFYVYALLTQPYFKQILLSSGNLFQTQRLTYEAYKISVSEKGSWHSYFSFLKFMLGVVSFFLIVYFLIVAIKYLNKLLKIKFE